MNSKKLLATTMAMLLVMGTYAQDGFSSDNLTDNLTNNQIPLQTEVEEDSITHYLNEIVVTGTRTPRKLKDSPVPIAIITSSDLKNGNILTLEDALIKLNPSFSVMTNGMGTTMSLNGLSDEYMLFLLNGRRMIGSNPYAQIDINRVKRIEIMSGAAAVLYGTNAIGGVVNIITDEAITTDEFTVTGSVQSHVSSFDRYLNSLNFTITSGKLKSSTSYTHNESGGWQFSPYVEKSDELVETEKQASVGFSRNYASQEFEYDVNDKLTLSARGSFYNNITKRPYAEYSYNLYHEDYTYGVGAIYELNDDNKLEFDYHSDNFTSSYDYLKAVSSAGAEIGDRIVRSQTHYHNANARGYFKLGSCNTLTAGLEYELNTLESVSDDLDYTTASTFALYAQDEIKIAENFYGLAGFRYVYHETFKSYATVHASLRYSIKNFNFRASYSSGFRTPDLSDIYASYESSSSGLVVLPNQDLEPEKSNYFSLNAEYNNSWMSLSATGFHNDIYDMIDYKTILTGDEAEDQYGASEVRIRSNIARARIQGVNVSLNVMPGAGLNFRVGYTGLDATDLESGDPINRSVRNIVTANAMWTKQWNDYIFSLSVNGRWSDERYSTSYGYAPSYQLWDIKTQHTFVFDKITIEPSIGIENLFDYIDDRPWNSNYATLTPGRSLFVSVAIKF